MRLIVGVHGKAGVPACPKINQKTNVNGCSLLNSKITTTFTT
jgi:hypothetical protein